MAAYDITILTDHRYVSPSERNEYIDNVLLEDDLLKVALEKKGLRVKRTNWDDPTFDWSQTKYIIFRTTWDYFERFPEFSDWLEIVSHKTKLINQKDLIYWNIDKHYLSDLSKKGIHIPPTIFIEKGYKKSLKEIVDSTSWEELILKPTVSGAARHTYRFKANGASEYESIYASLIESESMMLQEYQEQITTKGEVAYMVFGGKFSHAVLKKAKPGDFRVQDDFGGTIHHYEPNKSEIEFVEEVFAAIEPTPIYARVDVIWDNNNDLAVGEVELIEPELWFRMNERSADMLAAAILDHVS